MSNLTMIIEMGTKHPKGNAMSLDDHEQTTEPDSRYLSSLLKAVLKGYWMNVI